ncbi:unnamed protein product [Enterobius vermicularis]|uniref:Uncharacterized protein n=1 Tax=Enterobius vermicularis TaxID=51028 RepID=A0A0N4VLT0_ENTVE|nr:unnamed protein product [Enterobius vermicularis]
MRLYQLCLIIQICKYIAGKSSKLFDDEAYSSKLTATADQFILSNDNLDEEQIRQIYHVIINPPPFETAIQRQRSVAEEYANKG